MRFPDVCSVKGIMKRKNQTIYEISYKYKRRMVQEQGMMV